MAAEEVIHSPFGAQLSPRPHSSAPSPPEPVAEPPPLAEKNIGFFLATTFRPSARFVCPREHPQRFFGGGQPNGEDRSRQSLASTIGAGMTKSDAYTEIYLWNLNM